MRSTLLEDLGVFRAAAMREASQNAVAGTGLLIAGFAMLLSAFLSVNSTGTGLGFVVGVAAVATLIMILGGRCLLRYRELTVGRGPSDRGDAGGSHGGTRPR